MLKVLKVLSIFLTNFVWVIYGMCKVNCVLWNDQSMCFDCIEQIRERWEPANEWSGERANPDDCNL